METSFKNIKIEIEDKIATITIERPERKNADYNGFWGTKIDNQSRAYEKITLS